MIMNAQVGRFIPRKHVNETDLVDADETLNYEKRKYSSKRYRCPHVLNLFLR